MQNGPEIWIGENAEQVAIEGVRRIKTVVRQSVERAGSCSIVLSGGTTPVHLYKLLAKEDQLPWHLLSIWWVDERHVSHESPDSNFRLVQETLILPRGLEPHQIHPVPTELPLQEAADTYNQMLRDAFSLRPPNLVLLGVGSDGHTASLFSDFFRSPPNAERWCVAVTNAPKQPSSRISWTASAINQSENVLVVVAGREKAAAVCAALESDASPNEIPVRAIHPHQGKMVWLVDRAASSGLRQFR